MEARQDNRRKNGKSEEELRNRCLNCIIVEI